MEQLRHLQTVVENTEENQRPYDRPIRDVFRRLGNDAVDEVVARYKAGAHTTELMREFELSKSSVLKILRENNVKMRRQAMTPKQVQQATVMYEQGDSLLTTARALEVPKQTVRQALIKAGVEIRPSTAP